MPIDIYELIETPIPNFEKLYYTFMHRRAMRFVLDTYFPDHIMYDDLDYRAEIHDLDKCLFLALGGDKKEASAYHRENSPHHMEGNQNPTELDMIEAIIDYECAGFTKADKPLNAYDTVVTWNKPHGPELIALMEQFDMARSYENTPSNLDWVTWNNGWEPSEEEMFRDIDWFCQCEPQWAEQIVSQVRVTR